jgi:hypothetical protein
LWSNGWACHRRRREDKCLQSFCGHYSEDLTAVSIPFWEGPMAYFPFTRHGLQRKPKIMETQTQISKIDLICLKSLHN